MRISALSPYLFSLLLCTWDLDCHDKYLLHRNAATMALNINSITITQLKQYGNVPALAPPPGVVPNFAAHNERAVVYKILCSILLGILYVFLCLRLYAKLWIKRNPGPCDRETLMIPPTGGLLTDNASGLCPCGGGFHS